MYQKTTITQIVTMATSDGNHAIRLSNRTQIGDSKNSCKTIKRRLRRQVGTAPPKSFLKKKNDPSSVTRRCAITHNP